MALQVWLPLTKDLRNQGLGSVQTTNNTNFILKSGGKLGALCLDLSNTVRLYSPNLVNLKTFSFAFWYRPETSESTINWNDVIGFNDSKGGLFRLETSYSNSYMLSMHNNTQYGIIQNVAASYGNTLLLSSASYSRDVWYHIAVTIEENDNVKAYVNGELKCIVARSDGSITGYFNLGEVGGSHKEDGGLNDLRIYDHCLSPMEVKKLSQGLVLHYPLNRGGWGQENLLVDTYNWSTLTNANTVSEGYWYSNGGTAVRGYDNINNITYCKIWHSDSSSWTRYSRQYITMQPNTYYTVSILCRINTDVAHLSIRNDRNEAITFFASNVELTNKNWEWKFFTAKTHANTSQEPFVIYAQVNSDGVLSSDTSIDIAMVKLELGKIATPWCPNSTDELATTMGLNSTIEYDCSGFCNNGTRTGTFSWTSDTPKYQVSTYMSAAATISHTCCLDNTNQEWSCAAWVKPTTAGNYQNLNNFNESNRLYHGTYPLLYANSGANDYYNYGNLALPANQWSHIVFVFKNSTGTKLIYINGENHTNTNGPNKTSIPKGIPDTVVIGSGNYEGGLCDYREYATALSADDVKSLYQNCATIDPDGTIRGQIR